MASGLRGARRGSALLALAVATAFGLRQCLQAFVGPVSRREGLTGLLAGAATAVGPQPVWAYVSESNREAVYAGKAKEINLAADWYLFDLRKFVYPNKDTIATPLEACEKEGDGCPESILAKGNIPQLFKTTSGRRVGVSQADRMAVMPLKTLSTAAVFDPDTSDDLREEVTNFEVAQRQLLDAAMKGDIRQLRAHYDQGVDALNKFFKRVNDATELSPDSSLYLAYLPTDTETLEQSKFWTRRAEKYMTKKRVDAASKADKTTRFYAKSIYGEDAESWDVRGDRAPEFWGTGWSS